MSRTTKTPLSRESLLDGTLRALALASGARLHVMSDSERRASLEAALRCAPEPESIWVFGYGSLIWNPAFHYVERRIGRVWGYHRRFCLWTTMGRGSPDNPGLVLGLESGGSCAGVAYRVAPADVAAELDILWRREMITNAYRPVWVRVHTSAGLAQAVTFAINDQGERYSGRLGDREVCRAIATAEGYLGPCRDYLLETVRHLSELGIHDRALERLACEVRRLLAESRGQIT